MAKKKTMKEKVLSFVKKRGSARYTEIIKFIVDTKFGKGTYDSGMQYENGVRKNRWRGYYSGAFSGPKPYMLLGDQRLEKSFDGSYHVQDENRDYMDFVEDLEEARVRYVKAALDTFGADYEESPSSYISFDEVADDMYEWSTQDCFAAILHLVEIAREKQ